MSIVVDSTGALLRFHAPKWTVVFIRDTLQERFFLMPLPGVNLTLIITTAYLSPTLNCKNKLCYVGWY